MSAHNFINLQLDELDIRSKFKHMVTSKIIYNLKEIFNFCLGRIFLYLLNINT